MKLWQNIKSTYWRYNSDMIKLTMLMIAVSIIFILLSDTYWPILLLKISCGLFSIYMIFGFAYMFYDLHLRKNGIVTEYFKNEQMEYRISFDVNFKRHGKWKYWYENGQKKIQGNYHRDKRDGVFKKWHPNGQLEFIEEYHDGKINGVQKIWDENGNLIFTGTYTDGNLVGDFRSFNSSGVLNEFGKNTCESFYCFDSLTWN